MISTLGDKKKGQIKYSDKFIVFGQTKRGRNREEMNSDRQKGILYIVVPCYNEEEALEISAAKLLDKLHKLTQKELISNKSRIVFVDDGSRIGHGRLFKNCIKRMKK